MPIKTIGGDFLFVIIVWVSLNMASLINLVWLIGLVLRRSAAIRLIEIFIGQETCSQDTRLLVVTIITLTYDRPDTIQQTFWGNRFNQIMST